MSIGDIGGVSTTQSADVIRPEVKLTDTLWSFTKACSYRRFNNDDGVGHQLLKVTSSTMRSPYGDEVHGSLSVGIRVFFRTDFDGGGVRLVRKAPNDDDEREFCGEYDDAKLVVSERAGRGIE